MSSCGICSYGVSFDDSFTLNCYHTFCHKCLHDYIKGNLRIQIKCPNIICQKYIPDQIIRKCLSKEQTRLYDTLSVLEAFTDFRKCYTKGCPNIVSVDSDDMIFQCSYCEQPNCLRCQMRHYPNDCGRNNLNENDIDNSANEAIKRQKRKALEELLQSDEYIEYPEAFECSICCSFVLPRNGIMLRTCFHYFCRNCFDAHLKEVRQANMLKCPECGSSVDDREVIKLIGTVKLKDMICKFTVPKFFSCKTPDCSGLCDPNGFKSKFICQICNHENCLECEDIHEGMTCNEFQQSNRFQDSLLMNNIIKGSVKCKCGQLLIQQGGCAALKCQNCLLNICAFTRKIAGNKVPESCGCTSEKPCHPQCIHGCFPE